MPISATSRGGRVDYGYQHPANGYAYPYENGEHYSPYTYGDHDR